MESLDVRDTTDHTGTENVLVLTGPVGTDAATFAGSYLQERGGGSLVVVSVTGSPGGFVDAAVGSGGRPSRVATISGSDGPGPTEVDVDRSVVVPDPRDLTGLGIRIDQCFSAWGGDGDLLLCFDSLSALVQFAPLSTVFRFCHTITRKASTLGVGTVFSLDPTAVDEQTRRTLESLFDQVVDRR